MTKEKCFRIKTTATADVEYLVYAKNKKEAAKQAKEYPLNEMTDVYFYDREDDPDDIDVKEYKE